MTLLGLRLHVGTGDRNRDRRRRNFVPMVDGVEKRIAPGGLLPPPPPDGSCDPAPPTT